MPDTAIRLPLAGLTPLTTLDFPERLACVVFTQGCPLRCGYCHNPQMIATRRAAPDEWRHVRDFLEQRSGLLEAVVFSGGEPTQHAALAEAAREVKEMGFAVGLHTSGIYPRHLAALLPWIDWVGLDVKGHGAAFDRIAGRPGLWKNHAQSLEALLASGIDFECRTTLHWRDFTLAEVERLALSLADCGVRRYALQLARTDQCLDEAYRQPVEGAPPSSQLVRLVERLKPLFSHLELRA